MDDQTEHNWAVALASYALGVVALVEDLQDYSELPGKLRLLGATVAELDHLYPDGLWEEEAAALVRRELEHRHLI